METLPQTADTMTWPERERALSGVGLALDDLAAGINREHTAALEHVNAAVEHQLSALEHAQRAGALLLQAKDALIHGEWLPWLAAHTQVSARTAQRYMRRALKANTTRVAFAPAAGNPGRAIQCRPDGDHGHDGGDDDGVVPDPDAARRRPRCGVADREIRALADALAGKSTPTKIRVIAHLMELVGVYDWVIDNTLKQLRPPFGAAETDASNAVHAEPLP
jgi:hypothetical protein